MPRSDAPLVREFFVRAARRVMLLHAATGAGIGAVAGAAFYLLRHGSMPGWTIEAFAVAGFVAGALLANRFAAKLPLIVEQRAPACQNLVNTAHELNEGRLDANDYVRDAILQRASALVGTLDIATLFPARRAAFAVFAALLVWTGALAFQRNADKRSADIAHAAPANDPHLTNVDVDITAPAYAGGATRSLHNPDRIDALAGSKVALRVQGSADQVTLAMVGSSHDLKRSATDRFTGDFTIDRDGFVAIEPIGVNGRTGARRLIGISAHEDESPKVHITAPGKDEKFPDGHRTLHIGIDATDDIGVASLVLKYTRVTGSGERFTFTDGQVPLSVAKSDPHNWKAQATWALDSLKLDAGDMVVYRAVATDARPGSPPVESDAFIAEILAPGGIAAAGFAMDPEVERYAASQQMVILKTEKLLARKSQIAADSFADGAADVAAEQRRVRAEYVFMMGGEIGGDDNATGDLNEEAEANGEGELAAGRMQNQGRLSLLAAIRAMSRANTALTDVNVSVALTHEKEALVQIERTFAHSRIILRALAERERIDMTRRLSGTLTDASDNIEAAPTVEPVARIVALRQLLNDIAALSKSADSATAAKRATALAEQMLRIDPTAPAAQKVATTLSEASASIAQSRPGAARHSLDDAVTVIARMVRDAQLDAPPSRNGEADRLAGALVDAQRRGKGIP